MRILYIHGLDSSPNPERIAELKLRGHQVSALHIDYRRQPDVYQLLRTKALQDQTEWIIGSSLGGFIGFWLSEDLALPCLLFNPAMHVSLVEAQISPEMERNCPERWVLIGSDDEVVDPEASCLFFRNPDHQAPLQQVHVCQGMGHQIERSIFVSAVRWAGL